MKTGSVWQNRKKDFELMIFSHKLRENGISIHQLITCVSNSSNSNLDRFSLHNSMSVPLFLLPYMVILEAFRRMLQYSVRSARRRDTGLMSVKMKGNISTAHPELRK